MQVTEKAKHYGISSLLPEPVDPAKDLVLQFDLKLGSGLSCGGAYIKFLTADGSFKPDGLKDDTPYTVMFGPDKCGDTNKVRSGGRGVLAPVVFVGRCTKAAHRVNAQRNAWRAQQRSSRTPAVVRLSQIANSLQAGCCSTDASPMNRPCLTLLSPRPPAPRRCT